MPLSPAFSPDGRTIAFAGTLNGKRDIFALDLATKTVRNLTDDTAYDEAPVYSPDGKYLYHIKWVGGFAKIVRFPVDDPSKIEQVTWGDGNDEDPVLSPDGKRLYYASSRGGGIYNIYGQDLATGEILQYTDVIGSALGPSVFIGPDGQEKIVFAGYQAQQSQLYLADAKKPFRRLDEKAPAAAALKPAPGSEFTPALEVSVDPEKVTRPKKFKLFLSDVGGSAGIGTDGVFYSDVRLDFSDYLGNERFSFVFTSVYTYTNFLLAYYNLRNRLQWGLVVYDQRQYFVTLDPTTGYTTDRQEVTRETGVSLQGWWPFDRYTRVEGSVGFMSRKIPILTFGAIYDTDGNYLGDGYYYDSRSDNVPTVGVGFSRDTVEYKNYGPWRGNGLDVNVQYLPDLKDGGTLAFTTIAQIREYIPLSRRVLFALRAYGAFSSGNLPYYFSPSGYDRLRAYAYGDIYGNNAFVGNIEFRFPLIDALVFPFMQFGGIRGRVYLDVGGAWYKGQSFKFWDSENNQLQDAIADYGAGFSIYLFGLPLNFDFVQPWNFRVKTDSMKFIFSIGFPTF